MANNNVSPFLSKQGQTVIELAKLLLSREPGEELERVHDYASRFGVGVGTVQSALRYIQDAGAVELNTKGHLGTFIGEIDYRLLWVITGQEYIVGAMPLPYSRRYEGLATGLHETFKQADVSLNLMYSRGSRDRLRTLIRKECDFVVLSRLALNRALHEGIEIEEVIGLGAETYVGQHVILLRDHSKDRIEDGMRVGLDPQSIDQAELTREACRDKNVELVETNYMHVANTLQRGELDAAVWNGDDFATPSSYFKTVPLSFLGDGKGSPGANTEAVVVIDKSQNHLKNPLRSAVNIELVRDVQRQVMEGKLFPAY
jgi:hypothetical protein